MKSPTKNQAKQTSPTRQPPRPPCKNSPASTDEAGRNHAYIFQHHMAGIPAVVAISTVNKTSREAIAAAYLAADSFCQWAQAQLNA